MTNTVPTIDEVRKFLHKQITECRQHRPEQVDDLLDKLHSINETHAFIEQTIGDKAAAAWVETVKVGAQWCQCSHNAKWHDDTGRCGHKASRLDHATQQNILVPCECFELRVVHTDLT